MNISDTPLPDEILIEMISDGKNAEELIKNAAWIKVIRNLQEKALNSLLNLVDVDPSEIKEVTRLQKEVKRYKELVVEVDTIIKNGVNSQQYKSDLEEHTNE